MIAKRIGDADGKQNFYRVSVFCARLGELNFLPSMEPSFQYKTNA
jgi:hypothetical protein